MGGDPMTGGKRPGAGRPKADTVNVWLKLTRRSAARLRAIPVGNRSEFVSLAIEHAFSSLEEFK